MEVYLCYEYYSGPWFGLDNEPDREKSLIKIVDSYEKAIKWINTDKPNYHRFYAVYNIE